MRVGMEKKLFLQLALHDHYELACQRFRLDADPAHLRQELLVIAIDRCDELPHPNTRDELAHHHFFGAVLEMNSRAVIPLLRLADRFLNSSV